MKKLTLFSLIFFTLSCSSDKLNIKEIDFDQIFCDKVKCYYGSEIKSFYSDKNHLSISGSMKTVNLLKTFLK